MAKRVSPWGNDLHAVPFSVTAHYPRLEALFGHRLAGCVIEIGCGSGTDAALIAGLPGVRHVVALDLGENVLGLKHRGVTFLRASALAIPVAESTMDSAYSFGVFHHTEDPDRCIAEAHRVLKPGGHLLLYLYSAHETNPFKYSGVLLERALMVVVRVIPSFAATALCWTLSPIAWAIFSVPAMALRRLGIRADRLPMNWGTTPLSLVPDLKDRLLAPVNHRFTKRELERKLAAFCSVDVVRTSSGLYAHCVK